MTQQRPILRIWQNTPSDPWWIISRPVKIRRGTSGTECIPCQFVTVLNSLGPVMRSHVVSFFVSTESGSSDICSLVRRTWHSIVDCLTACVVLLNSASQFFVLLVVRANTLEWRKADTWKGHKANVNIINGFGIHMITYLFRQYLSLNRSPWEFALSVVGNRCCALVDSD